MSYRERIWVECTNVSRESIAGNMHQKISIRHRRHLVSTTLRFLHVEIHERSCGSSKDLAVRASPEPSAAPLHLR